MQRVTEPAPDFERAVHGLGTAKHVLDIRFVRLPEWAF